MTWSRYEANWVKLAPVGNSCAEYIDAPEHTERSTSQYSTTIHMPAISAAPKANPHLRSNRLRRLVLLKRTEQHDIPLVAQRTATVEPFPDLPMIRRQRG